MNSTPSPFFSRTYGGFTAPQEAFLRTQVGSFRNQTILDPMSGQGVTLGKLTLEGASVSLGDLNPAPLFLSLLRDPALLRDAERLSQAAEERLRELRHFMLATEQREFCETWIRPEAKMFLEKYAAENRIRAFGSPFGPDSQIWDAPPEVKLAACIPILAAREIVCFRSSDNITWIKEGGFPREENIVDALFTALRRWRRFAQIITEHVQSSAEPFGYLQVELMDAERGDFGRSVAPDIIATSPPYANRLDYTRMWAPELAVAQALFGASSLNLKKRLIGSTVVRDNRVDEEDIAALPMVVRRALRAIRDDSGAKASDSYYFPFFANYAVGLAKSLNHLALHLHPDGKLILFVRDTVRKDTLFPTAELVERVLRDIPGHGLSCTGRTSKKLLLVRHHLGLLRREATKPGVHGLVQREWFLAFKRRQR